MTMESVNFKNPSFEPTALLPPNDILDSAGTHLYRIGLSLHPFGSKKRKILYNPLIAFMMIFIFWIRCITALLLPEDNEIYFKMIGDYPTYLNGRVHVNLAIIPNMSLALVSQLINFWNYFNDIKPSYMKPFEMMSGLVSPQSIGLTDREDIYRLIRRSRILFKICGPLSKSMFFAALLCPLILFGIHFSIYEFLGFGLFWCVISSLSAYHSFSFHVHSMVYFHLICYYLKIKFEFINNEIITLSKPEKRFTDRKLMSILEFLEEIYSEISDYNQNYWSKYLCVNLALVMSVMNITLFHIIFGEISFYFKIFLIYANTFFALILLTLLVSASDIHSEVKRTYKLLNKLFICCKVNKIQAKLRIKV
jgi:hypothetical protein